MKVKRITIEVEVPVRTITSRELLSVVGDYIREQGVPHQAQVICEMSPNTRIGATTDFESNRVFIAGRWRQIQGSSL